MRKKHLFAVLILTFFCSACGTAGSGLPTEGKNGTETQVENAESAKINDVEINVVSLDICPEMTMARLAYDVRVLKETAHPEAYAGQFFTNLWSQNTSSPAEAADGAYRFVTTGSYTVNTEELKKINAKNFFGFNHQELASSHVKNDEMEITNVTMKEFEATDGNDISMSIKICPLGGRIESDMDWQKNERAAYVVADLKDGSSEYVIRIPAAVQGKDRKKYQMEPPEEVLALEEKDGNMFQLAGMLQPDLQSLVFYFDENPDMDAIEGFRLIIQELE